MGNDDYTNKRDFNKTNEPQGDTAKKPNGKPPIFVIQKHDATNLHYDFRIQISGTLKSWSVPKGPSTDPSEKRMAIPTEDHPMGYADFEGAIPEDQYGGGTVMIWDKGTFKNLKKDSEGNPISIEDSYDMGTVEIWLTGKKIKGGYSLIKMKSGNMQGNWLLIKQDDEEADARRRPTNTENKSVASGRTMKQIEKDDAP
ncbi:MAG: DNA ligase [Flavobacteriaceae bacterium]|nr:DNA ligase [Flavobacteriaceae bacterium]